MRASRSWKDYQGVTVLKQAGHQSKLDVLIIVGGKNIVFKFMILYVQCFKVVQKTCLYKDKDDQEKSAFKHLFISTINLIKMLIYSWL